MTYHPTPEQVQTVIDNLKKIEDQANQDGAFDISEMDVQKTSHDCGTVHCVAGWYAVANQNHRHIKPLIEAQACDYLDGGLLMANDLGIPSIEALESYMEANPEIWGNDYGDCLFFDYYAYEDLEPTSQNPMTIIIEHWQQVKKNLENLTQG